MSKQDGELDADTERFLIESGNKYYLQNHKNRDNSQHERKTNEQHNNS